MSEVESNDAQNKPQKEEPIMILDTEQEELGRLRNFINWRSMMLC